MDTTTLTPLLDDGQVLTDHDDLVGRRRDWWPLAWVRESRGEELELPGVVVRPTSHEQVADVVRWAAERGTPLVVRGGGSGVCGAAKPPAGAVVLETLALDTIHIDADAMIVTVGAGVKGDVLEDALAEQGLTLGHYPQSMALSTVGGWIGTSSAGQLTPGYGFVEDRVIGLQAVLGDGTEVVCKPTPRSAVGPDLRRLFIGSEGRFGAVTEVTLSCAPAYDEPAWQSWRFPDFRATWAFARAVHHSGAGPTVLRGWDTPDARAAFGDDVVDAPAAISVVGFVPSLPGLDERVAAVADIAQRHGGVALDGSHGATWWRGRLHAVETFEQVLGPQRAWGELTILDTSEVSATWPDLDATYDDMRAAITEHAAWVRCHYSHVFDSGLALYFSFAVEGTDVEDMEARYEATWQGAMRACVGAGASASHHHGMGRLKAATTPEDVGAGATEMLRRIQRACDPSGILNPGALLPDA